MLAGAAVISSDGLCPPFDASPNTNLFQHLFGIEFNYDNHSRVRGISPFEFARSFGFVDDLTYRLSQPANKFSLDAAVHARTSAWLFEQVHAHLNSPSSGIQTVKFSPLINSRRQLQLSRHFSMALSALAFCPMLDGSRDPECCAIRNLVLNPGKICKDTLKSVHYTYHQPLRQSFIVIEDDMLIFREPIRGSTSYTRLQIVPRGLYDIIFIAFHSNPIGGHLNAYRTLHRLRLRFH